jgi:hypothetical protein
MPRPPLQSLPPDRRQGEFEQPHLRRQFGKPVLRRAPRSLPLARVGAGAGQGEQPVELCVGEAAGIGEGDVADHAGAIAAFDPE